MRNIQTTTQCFCVFGYMYALIIICPLNLSNTFRLIISAHFSGEKMVDIMHTRTDESSSVNDGLRDLSSIPNIENYYGHLH